MGPALLANSSTNTCGAKAARVCIEDCSALQVLFVVPDIKGRSVYCAGGGAQHGRRPHLCGVPPARRRHHQRGGQERPLERGRGRAAARGHRQARQGVVEGAPRFLYPEVLRRNLYAAEQSNRATGVVCARARSAIVGGFAKSSGWRALQQWAHGMLRVQCLPLHRVGACSNCVVVCSNQGAHDGARM